MMRRFRRYEIVSQDQQQRFSLLVPWDTETEEHLGFMACQPPQVKRNGTRKYILEDTDGTRILFSIPRGMSADDYLSPYRIKDYVIEDEYEANRDQAKKGASAFATHDGRIFPFTVAGFIEAFIYDLGWFVSVILGIVFEAYSMYLQDKAKEENQKAADRPPASK
jgi:hypothetical protein